MENDLRIHTPYIGLIESIRRIQNPSGWAEAGGADNKLQYRTLFIYIGCNRNNRLQLFPWYKVYKLYRILSLCGTISPGHTDILPEPPPLESGFIQCLYLPARNNYFYYCSLPLCRAFCHCSNSNRRILLYPLGCQGQVKSKGLLK